MQNCAKQKLKQQTLATSRVEFLLGVFEDSCFSYFDKSRMKVLETKHFVRDNQSGLKFERLCQSALEKYLVNQNVSHLTIFYQN